MCMSGMPLWVALALILSVPAALLVLNALLSKYAKFYKEHKTAIMAVSVLAGLAWLVVVDFFTGLTAPC